MKKAKMSNKERNKTMKTKKAKPKMNLIQINFLKNDYYRKDGRRAGEGLLLKTTQQIQEALKDKKLIIVPRFHSTTERIAEDGA